MGIDESERVDHSELNREEGPSPDIISYDMLSSTLLGTKSRQYLTACIPSVFSNCSDVLAVVSVLGAALTSYRSCSNAKDDTILAYQVEDENGQPISLSRYEGKVCLVVNVASRCGYTSSNYQQLVALKQRFEGKDFEVLAFPCNQFGSQEPESCSIVQQKMKEKFNTNFPIFNKIDVNGDSAHPLYIFLRNFGSPQGKIRWNFSKFLCDKEGHPVKRYGSSFGKEIEDDVARLLEE